MAISFIDAGSQAALVMTATSVTLTMPASATASRVMYVRIVSRTAATISSAPGDWTEVLAAHQTLGAQHRSTVYRRVLNGSEAADYTWNFSASIAYTLDWLILSGVDTATPEDGTPANNVGSGASLSIVAPSISPATTTAWLLCAFSNQAATTTSSPGTMDERTDVQSTIGTGDVTGSMATEALSASGATGTRTATISGATNRQWIGQSIAVRGAPDGQPFALRRAGGRPGGVWAPGRG